MDAAGVVNLGTADWAAETADESMAEGTTEDPDEVGTAVSAVAGELLPVPVAAPVPAEPVPPDPDPAVLVGTSCCRVCWICVTSLSSLNCANWPTNCVGSMGLSGSWFCSCAISSCMNMLFNPCELGRALLLVGVVPLVGVSWG
jgi:hypothetical protein